VPPGVKNTEGKKREPSEQLPLAKGKKEEENSERTSPFFAPDQRNKNKVDPLARGRKCILVPTIAKGKKTGRATWLRQEEAAKKEKTKT